MIIVKIIIFINFYIFNNVFFLLLIFRYKRKYSEGGSSNFYQCFDKTLAKQMMKRYSIDIESHRGPDQ